MNPLAGIAMKIASVFFLTMSAALVKSSAAVEDVSSGMGIRSKQLTVKGHAHASHPISRIW